MKCYHRYHPEYTGGSDKPHVNDIIKLIMSEIKLSGILSPGVVKVFNRAVRVTANKGMDVCGVFETVFMWIKSVAMKEVKIKIQQLSDAITIKSPSGNIYDLPTIIKNVKYANKKTFIPFNDAEVSAFSTSIYLAVIGHTQQSYDILTVIIDGIVMRDYIGYFNSQFYKEISVFVLCQASKNKNVELNIPGTSKNVELNIPSITKRGPRNKHYSEVVKIVNLTLVKYPDVSTYSLSNKISAYLSKHRDMPSIQTVRRWVQNIRYEQMQVPREPHTKNFKLITS